MDFHAGGERCGTGVHAAINSRPSGSHHYLETRRLARAPRSQILRFMNGAAILEIRKRARQMRTDRARRFHNWDTNAAKNTPNRREKYHSPRARARIRVRVFCAPPCCMYALSSCLMSSAACRYARLNCRFILFAAGCNRFPASSTVDSFDSRAGRPC